MDPREEKGNTCYCTDVRAGRRGHAIGLAKAIPLPLTGVLIDIATSSTTTPKHIYKDIPGTMAIHRADVYTHRERMGDM